VIRRLAKAELMAIPQYQRAALCATCLSVGAMCWYTEQALEEVSQDQYPVRLFSGLNIVDLLRRANRAHGPDINPDWVAAVLHPTR
jgi:hypothetical protein